MKKFKLITTLFLSLLLLISCDKDFQEINTDPNNPTSVPAHLLLPGIVRATTNVTYSTFYGGDMGMCWAQQNAKVQYNDEARYIPRQTSMQGVWDNVFGNVLQDANSMYNLAEQEGNNNLMGAALILKAYGFAVLTDLYGDIPFSEALKAEENIILPVYDKQEDIYLGLFTMLDQAATLLGTGGSIDAGSDILYGGDIAKWKKFANSLKFRTLMRASGAMSVNAQLQALIAGGNMFSSNADEAKLIYLSAQPNANPLYETIVFGTRGEWKVSDVLVNMLGGGTDPRTPKMVALNDAGIYRGKPAGIADLPSPTYNYANVSAIGDFYLRPEAPGYFMSYAELEFLIAEAAHRNLITGEMAATHYANGITASFDANEVTGAATYIASNPYSMSNGMELISNQKWLALYCQGLEAWIEYRRTGFPVLTPAIDGALNEIPSRLQYPGDESSLNSTNYDAAVASQGPDLLTTKMWWDQ